MVILCILCFVLSLFGATYIGENHGFFSGLIAFVCPYALLGLVIGIANIRDTDNRGEKGKRNTEPINILDMIKAGGWGIFICTAPFLLLGLVLLAIINLHRGCN